jgi:hypothetical protein
LIGEGRGSQALAKALVETEHRVDQLSGEVGALRRSREKIFRPPPIEWIKDRLNNIHQVLERRTARSVQMRRNLLGPMRPELVTPDIGRPFYRAATVLDALALIDEPPPGAARIPIEAVIVDHADVPVYLKIADQAKHLRDLGINDRAIGRVLRVSRQDCR